MIEKLAKSFRTSVGTCGKNAAREDSLVDYGAKTIYYESVSAGSNCLSGPNVDIFDFG